MACSWDGAYLEGLQSSIHLFPPELQVCILHGSNYEFLDALAILALDPKWTASIMVAYEPLMVDICNRWLLGNSQGATWLKVLAALASIMPFAPHLSLYTEELLFHQRGCRNQALPLKQDVSLKRLSEAEILVFLLTMTRLLEFDNAAYAPVVSPSEIQQVLSHQNVTARYLAIKVLCLYLHAGDNTFNEMRQHLIGEGEILGSWDDRTIDYLFYDTWETRRQRWITSGLRKSRSAKLSPSKPLPSTREVKLEDLAASTLVIAKVLLPHVGELANKPFKLVMTDRTTQSIGAVVNSIVSSRPSLVLGPPGSGKSSIIKEIARVLCEESEMLTLHLNEQTDAKHLIGLHTASGTSGSFSWVPGVLTRAVQEGRWVLIEDIDHAPKDVMSLLLPLVERNELLVSNLGGYIQAARGFKLLATVRTTSTRTPKGTYLGQNLLDNDLWHQVVLQSLTDSDVREIISTKYPVLSEYQIMIMSVFRSLKAYGLNTLGGRKVMQQLENNQGPINLLRFCARVEIVLKEAGVTTGSEPISDSVYDCIFLEAIDCFAAGIQSDETRSEVIKLIAQEIQISPARVHYCMRSRMLEFVERKTICNVGRVTLPKQQRSQIANGHSRQRPFVRTKHALRFCESIAAAVRMREPCLLVGETGTGKTTLIQELARSLGHTLTVANLSQESEASDLLGGFKPLNLRVLAIPIKDDFELIFNETFPSHENQSFLAAMNRAIFNKEWSRLLKLLQGVLKRVDDALDSRKKRKQKGVGDVERPKKRKKTANRFEVLRERWENLRGELLVFQKIVEGGSKGFSFSFVEGNIIKAVREGDWVLLDEINLASPDVLESLADLISNDPDGPFILLSETGKIERVEAHPDFRIFGAMNPASDIGKRDLPPPIRSRFTELYVESPDRDIESLIEIADAYLGNLLHGDHRASQDIGYLYLDIKTLEEDNRLVDGAGQKPHFSLRTLTRMLVYVGDIAPTYGLRRALLEGFAMCFLTALNEASKHVVVPLLENRLFGKRRDDKTVRLRIPRIPDDGRNYIRFKHYWIPQGPRQVTEQPKYIVTPLVEQNLLNLVRATSTRRYPVLLQGPTSSGKTSMVEYLASISGNKCVRVNNHEHTDLQEYLGSYISDPAGRLVYQEGVLVRALREGHWIVLDELNLASSDILEALNRLLDDNRELLIPETQETVRPHESFMLFATQNPPGLYGGRKTLSRAFRNRFLELHFSDIPEHELETILRDRTEIAPSFCSCIVTVYKKLAILRQSERLFEQEQSFVTLRDLFRWANREAVDREELAAHGFMILGERVRVLEERLAVKRVIEDVMKTKVDEERLYTVPNSLPTNTTIVWTESMCRLFVLITEALKRNEPVLLIGETGTGKTAICQTIAQMMKTRIHILNAHQNTETGDLVGAQRPVRNRSQAEEDLHKDLQGLLSQVLPHSNVASDPPAMIEAYKSLSQIQLKEAPFGTRQRIDELILRTKALFEWSDSNLVHAMTNGEHFLLDEISLADDAVLERLNSVLEPSRTLFLAEKGKGHAVTASEGFQFLATMNPPGDYGKRELSPALRNRFTEIWVPPLAMDADVEIIIKAKLIPSMITFAEPMVAFSSWYNDIYNGSSFSLRGILTWVDFMNTSLLPDPWLLIFHGASMVFIDSLGANPAGKLSIAQNVFMTERQRCLSKLSQLFNHDMARIYFEKGQLAIEDDSVHIGPFKLARQLTSCRDVPFNLEAPTSFANALRIARALQLGKPVLIEGNPGVGKTTLVAALAQLVGVPLTRINLSEQTDIMDLFGSDVPSENAAVGQFIWRDAPFLQAMQRGEWVLLDEMNLASQTVLEGLNACLDHRGQVYIPELDQTFLRHPSFVVFAAQNPHLQGNGRKGLPASFVNRFTVVYADLLTDMDLKLICAQLHPDLPMTRINPLVRFISEVNGELGKQQYALGAAGSVEFNLRDLLRWLQLLVSKTSEMLNGNATEFLDLLFLHRLRVDHKITKDLRLSMLRNLAPQEPLHHAHFTNLSPSIYQVGYAIVDRQPMSWQYSSHGRAFRKRPESYDPALLESLMLGIQHRWPCLLVGQRHSGNLSALQKLAHESGATLMELPMNSDMDTMDLVGGYEQTDYARKALEFTTKVGKVATRLAVECVLSPSTTRQLLPVLAIVEFCRSSGPRDLHILRNLLDDVRTVPGVEATGSHLLEECSILAQEQSKLGQAQFEWVDGVLVRALQEGYWIVLRDSNLCPSSVLDRLNALMEPGGTLALTEHRLPDGSQRIVEPHNNFRLFLTVDPKYGELSRAMRNRCVELFFSPLEVSSTRLLSASSESLLSRYKSFQNIDWANIATSIIPEVILICLDHLSFSDFQIYQQFGKQVGSGLLDMDSFKLRIFTDVWVIFSRVLSQNGIIFSAMKKFYKSLIIPSSSSEEFLHTQPIHPLNNTPFTLSSFVRPRSDTLWMARLLDQIVELCRLRYDMDTLIRSADTVTSIGTSPRPGLFRPTDTYFESITLSLTSFVRQFSGGLQDWLVSLASSCFIDSDSLLHIEEAMHFLGDFCLDLMHNSLDEGVFQVYLEIGSVLADKLQARRSVDLPGKTLIKALHSLESPWTLKTGLGINRLWDEFRPTTAASLPQLKSTLQLETIASRFDDAVARLQSLKSIICSLRESIRAAFSRLWDKKQTSEQSTLDLIGPLEAIENESLVLSLDRQSRFGDAFEGLCQASWDSSELTSADFGLLELFASRATLSRDNPKQRSNGARLLSQIRHRTGISRIGRELMLHRNVIPVQILTKLDSTPSASLQSLEHVQKELEILQKCMGIMSMVLNADPLDELLQLLGKLLKCVFISHQDLFEPKSFAACLEFLTGYPTNIHDCVASPQPPSFVPSSESKLSFRTLCAVQKEFKETVFPSLMRLHSASIHSEAKRKTCAQAWITFFTGCLRLYLPDRVYDPAVRKVVFQNRFKGRLQKGRKKLEALQIYDEAHSPGITSFRYQLAERDLVELGDVPRIDHIFRPDISQIVELQREFSSILESIVEPAGRLIALEQLDEGKNKNRPEILLLRQNIDHSIRRFDSDYKAYDDLIRPLIGFLSGLDVGLALHLLNDAHEGYKRNTTDAVMRLTPLLDFKLSSLLDFDASELENDSGEGLDNRARYLQLASLALSIDHQASNILTRTMLRIFDSFYNDWKSQLQLDKGKHSAGSSLYQYRSLKQEDEVLDPQEFPELFPELQLTESPEAVLKESTTNFNTISSQEVTTLHQRVFVQRRKPSDQILSMIQRSSSSIADLWRDSTDLTIIPVSTRDMFSGVLLGLDKAVNEVVCSSIRSQTYDFYMDSNVAQVQKLFELVQKIQLRFTQIQLIWPEHATLAEVLKTSKELLAFSFSEALAKILTKVEQLHGFVYEWQTVASKEYTAATIYNDLTALIVSWRQLELSTWAGLLESEELKCRKDAKSWWFLAYEVIVAAPLEAASSDENLEIHVHGLAKSLGEFLTGTPLGQYQERLEILRQFRDHLQALIIEHPSIRLVQTALTNIIRYYNRHLPNLKEFLATSRSTLEKDVKEVIILATWKDTNINALRESSRRSRSKLLKVIRKYRRLLAQPASMILRHGLPEVNQAPYEFELVPSCENIPLLRKALQMCSENLGIWTLKPARFTQAESTARRITQMSTPASTSIDPNSQMRAFLADLTESVITLRKETPAEATEDNKADLKHLKTRKRMLLTHTLQALRLMGFGSNPGSQLLDRQASLYSLLAKSPSLLGAEFDTEYADHCFDKVVDNMSAIRSISTTQNEDLTAKEASRCVGYLESILSRVLDQRHLLASSLGDITKLNSILDHMSSLWRFDFEQLYRDEYGDTGSQLKSQVRWLSHLIEAVCEIIRKHDQMATMDSSTTINILNQWKAIFQDIDACSDQLVYLPRGLSTKHHKENVTRMSEAICSFGVSIEKEELNCPTIKFILSKLRAWTTLSKASSDTVDKGDPVELSTLDECLSGTVDFVLANVQQVQEALSNHPTSVEQLGWLVHTDGVIGKALRLLRIGATTSSIEKVLKMMECVSQGEPKEVQLAAALCTVPAPILRQYLDTARDIARRYLVLHQTCCNMLYSLTKIYKQIATDGFCSPQEKATNSSRKAEKLEDGTGLGEGEGAEDISKDIADDEDLSELAAQKPTREDDHEEMQDQEDAVNMQHDELEGELSDGTRSESGDDKGRESSDDDAGVDDEIGSVNDLDPSAVDEKLWDEPASHDQKEKETDRKRGQKEDELTAQHEGDDADEKKENLGSEGDEDHGVDESEQIESKGPEEVNSLADEGDHLDLPDEMEIDGKDKPTTESESDDLDALSDNEQSEPPWQDNDVEEDSVDSAETSQVGDDDVNGPSLDDANLSEKLSEVEEEKNVGEDQDRLLQDVNEQSGQGDAVSGESGGEAMGSEKQEGHDRRKDSGTDGLLEQNTELETGERAQDATDGGEQGRGESQVQQDGHNSSVEQNEDRLDRAFKQLGDAFEKWHRQNQQIQNAQDSEQDRETITNADAAKELFEHLPDENAASDAQALGAAMEEEAHALDKKAMEAEVSGDPTGFPPDDARSSENDETEDMMQGIEIPQADAAKRSPLSKPASTFINGRQRSQSPEGNDKQAEDEAELFNIDTNLSTIHLHPDDSSLPRSNAEARQLWAHYEAQTCELSLVLTEQLRLILAPTLATKMRGDFRTGKRLNIKRIIPYIASGYKRDKIWMRRSVPSKRSYQIMLAVDDSKSMGASGSGELAFETLALVSKSLGMLEVGQICIVGFGDKVRVAHEFDQTFSSDAGASVFQHFGFRQTKTNVRNLMAESIKLFREARAKALNSAIDLWQLELIISDGVCEDHEGIRRLVRQAHEERIMVVFVIVDGVKGESIMDMTRAEFEDDGGESGGKVKIKRYLEGFPFTYYLIVGNVKELPGVLATALRQWFAEVAER